MVLVFGHEPRLGPTGERIAAKYLRRHGHRILMRNYRCPAGEIDLVAAQGDTLVFVEVKTRSSDDLAMPEDAVDAAKRRQILRAARYFLAQMKAQHLPIRFDVVAIVLPPRGAPQIEHFIAAFASA
jgi:putative endonuclease